MLPFGSLVLPVLVLLSRRLATGAHEHDVHEGPLSPISYPPDRMVPLSHRRRSGVASNFESEVHTPQSPSHSLLDCIQPGELDCPLRAGSSWAPCRRAPHSPHDCSRVHCWPCAATAVPVTCALSCQAQTSAGLWKPGTPSACSRFPGPSNWGPRA